MPIKFRLHTTLSNNGSTCRPGFEGGANFRFSRYLALECISCHNGLPALVMGLPKQIQPNSTRY